MSIMESYCETKFLNDFKKKYDSEDEYDYTILFDDFYSKFIEENTEEFLKTVYQYYYHIDEYEEVDEDVLYQTLYSAVEKMMVDDYESDAETDSED